MVKIRAFLASLFCLAILAVSAAPALAQRERDGAKPPVKAGQDERRRDDAQRGERRDARQERMRPEEREKLRRDIEDANRNMKKR